MFIRGKRIIVQDEAGAGNDGSSADNAAATAAAELSAKIAAAVEKEVSGLKAKNAELIGKEKSYKETLAKFEGIDPEKIKATMAHLASSEEARLMAEGKLDEVISRRTAKRDEEIARQLAEKDGEVSKAKERAAKFNDRVMQNEIRSASPTDLHPSAMKSVLLQAGLVFELNEEGDLVPRDGKFGKDGKKLYTPTEWYEDLRQTDPIFFVNGNSGSSNFDKSGKGGSNTISRSKFDSLPSHEKAATIKAGITVVDR